METTEKRKLRIIHLLYTVGMTAFFINIGFMIKDMFGFIDNKEGIIAVVIVFFRITGWSCLISALAMERLWLKKY